MTQVLIAQRSEFELESGFIPIHESELPLVWYVKCLIVFVMNHVYTLLLLTFTYVIILLVGSNKWTRLHRTLQTVVW